MNATNYIIPKLTPEQKELARQMFEVDEPFIWADRLALSPPAGLGIRMSRATVYRLKQQLELEEDLSDRESIQEQARAVANEEQNATLESAAITLLRAARTADRAPPSVRLNRSSPAAGSRSAARRPLPA